MSWKPLFRKLSLKSIRAQISVAFSCLILLAIASTTLFFYRFSIHAVERNLQEYTSGLIKQIDVNIQSYFTTMENISLLALNNADVKRYVSSVGFSSEEERMSIEKRISDLFQSILITRKDIASIMVFGYNGRFVSDRRITNLNRNVDPAEQLWYKKAKEASGLPVVTAPHVKNIIQNEYRWVVSLSREIKPANGITGEGIFLVDLNADAINENARNSNLGKRGYVFIVDQEGQLVSHPQQQLVYGGLQSEPIGRVLATDSGSFMTNENGEKKVYTVQESRFGWKIVGVAYVNELVVDGELLRTTFLLWAIVCIVVALLFSYGLSVRLTRPMKMLQQNMKQVEQGNFSTRAEIQNVYEVDQLAKTFNLMLGHIVALVQEIVREQEQKRRSELKALQAQINPHFLYNTLDSIIWMAEEQKHEQVVRMTSALSKLLRASINIKDELVPIRLEKEHITQYLTIQKMRYADQLDYSIDFEPAILPYQTLKITLQPFIENAIYHGIKNSGGAGFVRITGEQDGECVLFRIKDNGKGMSPEQLKTILEPKPATSEGKGIGIHNVNERIKLYFGAQYGIRFYSEPEAGTEVVITLPKYDGRKEETE